MQQIEKCRLIDKYIYSTPKKQGNFGEEIVGNIFEDLTKKTKNDKNCDFTICGEKVEVKTTLVSKVEFEQLKNRGGDKIVDGLYGAIRYFAIENIHSINDEVNFADHTLNQVKTDKKTNEITCEWFIYVVIYIDGIKLFITHKNNIKDLIHDQHGETSKNCNGKIFVDNSLYAFTIDSDKKYNFQDIINQIEKNDTNK